MDNESEKPSNENEPRGIYVSKSLMTKTEALFNKILLEALPEFSINRQVSLGQLLGVADEFNHHQHWNRINRMAIDFVISDDEGNPIAAIELDDRSHDNPKRKADDVKKDNALQDANIRIFRWDCRNMPTAQEVRDAIVSTAKPEDREQTRRAIVIHTMRPASKAERRRQKQIQNAIISLTGTAIIGIMGMVFIQDLTKSTMEKIAAKNKEAVNKVTGPSVTTTRNDTTGALHEYSPEEALRGNDLPARPLVTLPRQSPITVLSEVKPMTPQEEECKSWKSVYVISKTDDNKLKMEEACSSTR